MSEELEHWTLRRLPGSNSQATYGEFRDGNGGRFCYTVERPYVDANHDGITDHGVSCIPAGTYLMRRRWSGKHGCEVFEFTGVPGRSDCEIHVANLAPELEGCVAPGQYFGNVETKHHGSGYGVCESKSAFDALMAHFKGVNEWLCTITDPPGVSHA